MPNSTPDIALSLSQSACYQVFWSDSVNVGVARAFAVSSNRLGTNGHVVLPIADTLSHANGWASVLQNETGQAYPISCVWVHASYDGNSSTTPDVGVIEVDGYLPSWLHLAPQEALYALNVFESLTLCGFPGDVFEAIDFTNLAPGETIRPRATCQRGF